MENKKTIDVINSLITINNDRIEGYDTALQASEELDLKTLFAKFIATSQECKQELVTEVSKLGGEPAEGTKTSGKFFRAWMDVKAALTGKDRKAILNSCDYGEEKAQDTYDNVLEDDREHLSADLQNKIVSQRSSLQADHRQIKTMRDALVDA